MIGNSKRLSILVVNLAALFALLLPGCGNKGPKLATVKGFINYKGKPVPQGSIMFQPADGPAATAEIKEGNFVLKTFRDGDGAVLGKHKVTIISLPDQSGLLPENRNPLPEPLVPFDYSFPDKSGLNAVVEDRPNVINFDLK